jgi:pre-rRNA-processing protein IPI3
MGDEERYAVASISAASGALHVWLRRDGTSRRSQSDCRPASSAAIAGELHRGHLFLASSSTSGTSCTICAHALQRVSGGPAGRSASPEPRLAAVALAPGTGLLAAGGVSGRCYLWSLASGDLLASWDAHFRSVLRIAFTDDEATIITAGTDASVLAFDVAELVDVMREKGDVVKPRLSLHGHDLPVTAVAVGFGGVSARVVTGSRDCSVKVWHLSSGRCVGSVAVGSAVVDVALAPDEGRAFVGLESGAVAVVEVARLRPGVVVAAETLRKLVVPVADGSVAAVVTAVSASPRGAEVVVGYGDGFVRVFDVETGMQLMVYSKHGDAPVTWVGVLSPIPDVVLQDVGGRGAAGSNGASSGAGDEDGAAAGPGAAAALPEGLLFEGALRKSVEPDLESLFLPRVVLAGAGNAGGVSHVWSAVDRALELAAAE